MLRNALLCLSAAIAATCVIEPAAAQTATAVAVPSNLKVPAGHMLYMRGVATGTQNYVCLPAETGMAWVFQGPQATVFLTLRWITGEIRQQIMTHYLSPNPMELGTPRATWLSSLDTSAVWAKKIEESSDPAYVAPGAIPWFLLQMVGTHRGPTDGSLLTRTSYIQRVNTTGGMKPNGSCDLAGALQFVPYTAEYLFYQANPQ